MKPLIDMMLRHPDWMVTLTCDKPRSLITLRIVTNTLAIDRSEIDKGAYISHTYQSAVIKDDILFATVLERVEQELTELIK